LDGARLSFQGAKSLEKSVGNPVHNVWETGRTTRGSVRAFGRQSTGYAVEREWITLWISLTRVRGFAAENSDFEIF
jgi:hypothetical protein